MINSFSSIINCFRHQNRLVAVCTVFFFTGCPFFHGRFSLLPFFPPPFDFSRRYYRCRFFRLPNFPLPFLQPPQAVAVFTVALFTGCLFYRSRFFQLPFFPQPFFPVAIFSVAVITVAHISVAVLTVAVITVIPLCYPSNLVKQNIRTYPVSFCLPVFTVRL